MVCHTEGRCLVSTGACLQCFLHEVQGGWRLPAAHVQHGSIVQQLGWQRVQPIGRLILRLIIILRVNYIFQRPMSQVLTTLAIASTLLQCLLMSTDLYIMSVGAVL